jgi:hypothetical protein
LISKILVGRKPIEVVENADESSFGEGQDCLLKDKQPISLASLAARSKEVDPEGRGVSEAAILNNEEARKYYEQHRAWKGSSRTRSTRPRNVLEITAPIKIGRNVSRARYRYLKMSKAELVERLLAVEQKYAKQEEQWLQVNEELVTWRLRAERAESRGRAELAARKERQKE